MSLESIRKKVLEALCKLRTNDHYLLEAKVNERTISHKLAEYLQEEFELVVDCEYNRHKKEPKRIFRELGNINCNDTDGKTVFPDIVVHKRGTDDENLLVIEIKKSSNPIDRDFDREKIVAFTTELDYKFGLFLEINVDNPHDYLEWYEEGRPIRDETIGSE